MSKKLYGLTIRGNQRIWLFDVYVDSRYVEEWRMDGIDIDDICNTIPVWIVNLGLTKAWCFLQDCFYFKNPFDR